MVRQVSVKSNIAVQTNKSIRDQENTSKKKSKETGIHKQENWKNTRVRNLGQTARGLKNRGTRGFRQMTRPGGRTEGQSRSGR